MGLNLQKHMDFEYTILIEYRLPGSSNHLIYPDEDRTRSIHHSRDSDNQAAGIFRWPGFSHRH